MHSRSAFNARDNGDIHPISRRYKLSTILQTISYYVSDILRANLRLRVSSNTLLPSHSCGHDIPESNAACMRVVCAMHTLHTLKLEFVKRFQTSPAVKFSVRIFHTLPQCHYIFILIKKKQTNSISNKKILYVLYM